MFILGSLVIIELFALDVTAEGLRAKIDRKSAISLQGGQFDPNFQVEKNYKKGKKGIAVCRQACHHRYGNSHAIWDHTVLPATRQR